MPPGAFERSLALPGDFGVAKGRDFVAAKSINNVPAAHRPLLYESKRTSDSFTNQELRSSTKRCSRCQVGNTSKILSVSVIFTIFARQKDET